LEILILTVAQITQNLRMTHSQICGQNVLIEATGECHDITFCDISQNFSQICEVVISEVKFGSRKSVATFLPLKRESFVAAPGKHLQNGGTDSTVA
jgi:hypothetical protein